MIKNLFRRIRGTLGNAVVWATARVRFLGSRFGHSSLTESPAKLEDIP